MKIPKNLGGFGQPGGGMNGMMQQLQASMAQMQEAEEKLLNEIVEVEKQFVKVAFDGQGNIKNLDINLEDLSEIDHEMLADIILSAVQNGIEKAKQLKESKMKDIMPSMPGMPGF